MSTCTVTSSLVTFLQQQQQQKEQKKEEEQNSSNTSRIPILPIPIPEFYSVSCTVHKTLCHKYNIHGYPKIKLLPIGTTNFTDEIPYWKLHPNGIITKLNITLGTFSTSNIVIAILILKILNSLIMYKYQHKHKQHNSMVIQVLLFRNKNTTKKTIQSKES